MTVPGARASHAEGRSSRRGSCYPCLFAVEIHLPPLLEGGFCGDLPLESVHDDFLILKDFVGSVEVLDLLECVFVDVGNIIYLLPARVVDWHGNDFIINIITVDHLHQCDWACTNQNAGNKRVGGEENHIES